MFYHLFTYLDKMYNLAGASLFYFISFRAVLSIIIALIISWLFGGRLINRLNNLQVKDEVRKLGLEGENQKSKTPTMGGLIILAAILIPTILLSNFSNVYIWLMVGVTIWLGLIGFADDYIKVFKKDKGGLRARSKLIGQLGLGLIVGVTLYFNSDVIVRKNISKNPDINICNQVNSFERFDAATQTMHTLVDDKVAHSYMPFLKTHTFDYSWFLKFMDNPSDWAWIIYIPAVMLIVTFISNGCNLTDGLDGLATGVSLIVMVALLLIAYMTGNYIVSDYLHLLHLPGTGELVVFCAAVLGACVGFMWYNANPAQVFMGDTGSLALGGIIASLIVILRLELLIPLLCGIFIIENLSVMIQVGYFKYAKRKHGIEYARNNRVFLMSPLHHHYQKKGMSEVKIVVRFWIVQIMLIALFFLILKIR